MITNVQRNYLIVVFELGREIELVSIRCCLKLGTSEVNK